MQLLAHNDFVNTTEITSRDNGLTYVQQLDLGHLFRATAEASRELYTKTVKFRVGSYNSALEGTVRSLVSYHQERATKSLLSTLILKENQDVDVDALTITSEAVLDAIGEFGPAIVRFEELTASRVQGEHLATMLRTSYVWRNEIPGWTEALEIAREALSNEGIDPADALYGMVKS
ncbi:hypothetical protein [Pseudomonas sp. EL_65y_Pfl1_R32]|uniref:hypothetical protein n=1 Tax=Pseudomonas sp. EL_65y_Pfl1_R32 TaxID=3088696 RepID=UPI0030DD1018